MRTIILALILSVGLLSNTENVLAQKKMKTLESSEKKQPSWVNGLEQGYIITTASSQTLDDAQQKALAKVKEQIISSVAENIQSSSDYYRSEEIKNNDADFAETFSTATKTQAADIPFIKGISLSNVEAYYWEKVRDASGEKYYYHIKYPFGKIQLKKLIDAYELAEKEKTERLTAAINKIEGTNSVEEYSAIIKELQALEEGFIEVDPRKNQAQASIAIVKQMLKDVSIETINSTLGEIKVALRIGENAVTTSRKPTVKSNCAKIVSIKSKSPEWIITYTYDECYDDPDNKVTVEFKNGYGRAKNEYFFNVNSEKLDIFVNNDVSLSGGSVKKDSLLSGASCNISVTAKYESAFVVEKVVLSFGKEAPITIDGINQEFSGRGKHDLNLTIEQTINKNQVNAQKYDMIKGAIHYKSVKTGEKSIYKMFNQKVTTGW